MSRRYRNVGPLTFAGIGPGEEGEIALSDAQVARHVKAGRLVPIPDTTPTVQDHPPYLPEPTPPEPTPSGLDDEPAHEREEH